MYGNNFCTQCGWDLTCKTCNGMGEVPRLATYTPSVRCHCGCMVSDNFCGNCGSPNYNKPPDRETCRACNGTGTILGHPCKNY